VTNVTDDQSPQRVARRSDKPVTVVVVDDHPMWRDGVRADLEADGRARVVGEAATADEAVTVATREHPDLVLIDLNMPGLPGTTAISSIAERLPGTRMLVLSASAAEPDVLEAVKAGASGYLLKSATGGELVEAVQQVAAGEPVFSPSLAALVLGEFRRVAAGGGDRGQDLTDRETEVLRLVARGYTYGDIAERLVISVRTVQNHVQSILTKLQLRGRYELMRYAIHRGLDRDDE
jgi:DNA-binding NarL/FixJ family response regulator